MLAHSVKKVIYDAVSSALLDAMEKKWNEFVASSTAFHADLYRDGSIAGLFAARAHQALLEARIKQFE